jgi:hypothetical protein
MYRHPAGPNVHPLTLPWVPYGAPYFTRHPHAAAADPWHVVIVGGHLRNGHRIVWSTDIKGTGEVHPVLLPTLLNTWGHDPVGWTHDLNGYRLKLPLSPARRDQLGRA